MQKGLFNLGHLSDFRIAAQIVQLEQKQKRGKMRALLQNTDCLTINSITTECVTDVDL